MELGTQTSEDTRDNITILTPNFACYKRAFRNFILPIFSIISYVFDIGSDILLVIVYALSGNWWWCGWTLTFVLATAVLMAVINIRVDELGVTDRPFHIHDPKIRWSVKIAVIFSVALPVVRWVAIPVAFYSYLPNVETIASMDCELIFQHVKRFRWKKLSLWRFCNCLLNYIIDTTCSRYRK